MLGIGRSRAYEWINASVLPALRVGRRVYVKCGELQQWINGSAQSTIAVLQADSS